jgi:hypothetical protein
MKKTSPKKPAATKSKPKPKPKRLSGGNPQIPKADGDAPVQTYIAAMPSWKGDFGRQLDTLITRTIPNVHKAVRWNTPFYGVDGLNGGGWFLAFHCLANYVKVAFFRGTSLRPLPPGESTQKEVRYLHLHQNDRLDEQLLTTWIQQAAKLPGSPLF